jgi:Phage integrase family
MVGIDDWHGSTLPPGPSTGSSCPSVRCSVSSLARRAAAHGQPRELRRFAAQAGVRRRFAPHQLRHAHAIEMAHEGIPLPIIQRQLGHAHLGITSIYLQGIDTREIVDTVHHRRPPVIPASAGLRPKPKRGHVIGASRAPCRRRTRGPRPRPGRALPMMSGRASPRGAPTLDVVAASGRRRQCRHRRVAPPLRCEQPRRSWLTPPMAA